MNLAARDPETAGRDRGVALPIALVVSVVFGAVIVALAGYVSTALRNTAVTDSVVDRLADADAGMRSALVVLDDTGDCPPMGAIAGQYNGSSVSVTSCDREVIESESSSRTFGLVLTDLGPNPARAFVRSNPQNGDIEIGGDIYLSAGVGGEASNVEATGRVLREHLGCAGYDPVPIDWLGGVRPECVEITDPSDPSVTWRNVSPPPSGITLPTNTGSHSPVGSCRVYEPGTYSSISLSGPNARTYFRSGVYRVTGAIEFRGEVTAGHPGGVTSIVPGGPNAACLAAQQTDVDDGSPGGVVFVLSGNGHLDFTNQFDHADLFGLRVGSRVLSVVAGTTPTGFSPASTRAPATQPLITNNANTGDFAFFGEVWAPGSWIDPGRLASWQAGRGFLGGLTAARFTFAQTPGIDTGLLISVDTAPVTYRYRITVRAEDDRGATSVTAIARLRDGAFALDSWRVGEPGDLAP